MDSPTKVITKVIGVLGIFLMAFPFVFDAPTAHALNDVLVGGTITALSGYNYSQAKVHSRASKRVSGVMVLLGVWLLVVPFILDVTGVLRWSDVATGILVTAFAGYNMYVTPIDDRAPIQHPPDET